MYWLEQQKQQKQTILRRAVLTAREVDPLAESVPLYRSVGKMYAFSSICVCVCRVSVCVCVCVYVCVCVCVALWRRTALFLSSAHCFSCDCHPMLCHLIGRLTALQVCDC